MAEVTDTAIVAKSSAASATEADLDADAGIEMKSADAGEVQVKVNGGGGSGKLTQRKLTQLLLDRNDPEGMEFYQNAGGAAGVVKDLGTDVEAGLPKGTPRLD